MIEIYKHFNIYKTDVIPPSFQPRHRISRKHNLQLTQLLSKDGVRGVKTNLFYFRCAPAQVVNAANMNCFKNQLDIHWSNVSFKYEYTKVH